MPFIIFFFLKKMFDKSQYILPYKFSLVRTCPPTAIKFPYNSFFDLILQLFLEYKSCYSAPL